jgi:hypothetical protein
MPITDSGHADHLPGGGETGRNKAVAGAGWKRSSRSAGFRSSRPWESSGSGRRCLAEEIRADGSTEAWTRGSPAAIAPRETLEMTGPHCGAKGGNGRAGRDRNPALREDRLHIAELKLSQSNHCQADAVNLVRRASRRCEVHLTGDSITLLESSSHASQDWPAIPA